MLRVRFPLTAPRGVGIWGVPRPSKPKKPIRFPHAAPEFRDVGNWKPTCFGGRAVEVQNPLIPTSFTGSGLVLKAPVSGTGDRGLKSRLPDQIDAGLRSGSSVVSLVRQLTDSIPVPATIFGGPRRLTAGFLILDQGTRIRLPPRVRGRGGVGVLAALSMPRTPVRVRSSPPSFMACSSIGRMADFQSVKAGSTPAQATKGALCKSSTTFRCGEPRLTKVP